MDVGSRAMQEHIAEDGGSFDLNGNPLQRKRLLEATDLLMPK